MIHHLGLFVQGVVVMLCATTILWLIGFQIAALALGTAVLMFFIQVCTGILTDEWSLRALIVCVGLIIALILAVLIAAPDGWRAVREMIYFQTGN
jgi:hypothetical protein